MGMEELRMTLPHRWNFRSFSPSDIHPPTRPYLQIVPLPGPSIFRPPDLDTYRHLIFNNNNNNKKPKQYTGKKESIFNK